jgi:hypothetical protein
MYLYVLLRYLCFSLCVTESSSGGLAGGNAYTVKLSRRYEFAHTAQHLASLRVPALKAIGRSAHRFVGYPAHRQ